MTIALADLVFRYNEQDNGRVPKLNDLTSYVLAASLIVADGDKGDIVLSASGTVWEIDAGVIVDADVNAAAAIALTKLAATTASRALVSSGAGVISVATTTATEIGYVNGVTSAIQTQLDARQPLDSDLTTIAGLTATTDNFIVSVASAWASRTPSQVRITLGLVIGTDVQAYDADLTTWAGITPGTGVATALAVNVGSAGAFVTFNGAGGTPSSLTLTNATGLPNASVIGLGTAALKNTGTSGDAVPVLNGARTTWAAGMTWAGELYTTVGAYVTSGEWISTGQSGSVAILDVIGGAAARIVGYNLSAAYIPVYLDGSQIALRPSGTAAITIDGTFGDFANDAAAAAGGVPVKGLYRNGSVMMFRVA